ncbi:mannitol dehydrogenase family protein [Falsochrobactrum sp. TDYN1]|uniref:Mannitol dehydrogenase family protein n=1 Tax=Falsochrobactrum tianjinense TaxID=2706015 RepID=A0A949UST1_9HYPH|nr:mannitol dehydrogenase family protein [Falsochrobactrum sp. TDYN1]MBV2143129.1 mannitol dehydrogenase family protein [Falsochrobactrum sp. TDYN1]
MSGQPSILQFGTSRFLLGHADFFISEALAKGDAIGTVAIVQTTANPDSARRIAALNSGQGYPVIIRGLSGGKPVDVQHQARSVTAAYSAHQDWQTIRTLSANVKVILSNTADKGYELDGGDDSTLITSPDRLPKSFPAKLLVLLHHRWQTNPDAPLSIFPCELISRNGDKLRSILLQMAQDWSLPDTFRQWIETKCVFANSLVDRIVSEPIDPVGAIAEPYALWAIEKTEGLTLPCQHPDIVVTDDLARYERLKLYLLNLGHTYIAEQWLKTARPKDEIVLEAMQDPAVRDGLEAMWREEVLPVFAADDLGSEAETYVGSVRERFLNPFLKHRIADIASNHEEKKQRRFAPIITRAKELGLDLEQYRLRQALGEA